MHSQKSQNSNPNHPSPFDLLTAASDLWQPAYRTYATTPAATPINAAAHPISTLAPALPVCSVIPELVADAAAFVVVLPPAAAEAEDTATTFVTVELAEFGSATAVVTSVTSVTAPVLAPAAGMPVCADAEAATAERRLDSAAEFVVAVLGVVVVLV